MFLLFEYGCKYIKDGRNFHILNIEQVGRRLSLAEVERAQLVSWVNHVNHVVHHVVHLVVHRGEGAAGKLARP